MIEYQQWNISVFTIEVTTSSWLLELAFNSHRIRFSGNIHNILFFICPDWSVLNWFHTVQMCSMKMNYELWSVKFNKIFNKTRKPAFLTDFVALEHFSYWEKMRCSRFSFFISLASIETLLSEDSYNFRTGVRSFLHGDQSLSNVHRKRKRARLLCR